MPSAHPELFDPASSPDYAAILEPLRRDEPIFYSDDPRHPSWIITRHRDVLALLRDKRLVVPALATRISTYGEAQKKQLEPMQNFIRDNLGRTRERRRDLRKLTKAYFKPSAVARLRGRISEIIEELHEQVDTKQPVDLVTAYAYPMPAIVMAEMLGVPKPDRPRFIGWSQALISFHRSYDFESMLSAQAGVVEMLDYCGAHIRDMPRDGEGGDGMSSAFARACDAGQFEMGELASTCATFLMAGHENTSHLIGNIIKTLFAHPQVFEEVKKDLSLIPQLIYETLRYNGVVPFLTREVAEGFEYEGHAFEPGQLISLSLFSANRDDEAYPNVDIFDIHNPRARMHLGFGHGENQCRGSHLALVETEVLLNFLISRFPGMQAVEGGMETLCQPMLRRYVTKFEVRLKA